MASMDVIPLFGCLYNGISTLLICSIVGALGGGMGGKLTMKAGDSNANCSGSSSLSACTSSLSDGGVLTLTGGAGAMEGGDVSNSGGADETNNVGP